MSTLVLGSGEVRPGMTVLWSSLIGDQRGRVANMRAGGYARVEVFAPGRIDGRRSYQPNGQVIDLPVSVLRPMLVARGPTPKTPGVVDVKAKAPSITELSLYGDVGGFEGAITSSSVKAALANYDPKSKLNVFLSSPGGSPFEASAISSILSRWSGMVTVFVDGLAASAASIIALAGTNTYMSAEAMFMIHRSHTLALGNRNELAQTMAVLDKVDGLMADVYARKSGLSRDRVLEMMTAETWMDATEAKKFGFSDGTVEPPRRNPVGVGAMLDRPWFARTPDGTRRPLPADCELEPAVSGSQSADTASATTPTAVPGVQNPEETGDTT